MELKKYNFFSEYSIGMPIFLGTNNVVKYRNAIIGLTGKLYCSIEQATLFMFSNNNNYHLFIIKIIHLRCKLRTYHSSLPIILLLCILQE